MQVIVDKYGAKLSIENSQLSVSYKGEKNLFDLNKVRQIHCGRMASLSSAVIHEAINRGIDLQFIDKRGFPIGRIWSNKFGTIATLRRKQLQFSQSIEAVSWITAVLSLKANRQIGMLKVINDSGLDSSIDLKVYQRKQAILLDKLDNLSAFPLAESANEIRAVEGNISRQYFKAIRQLLPGSWQFKKRSYRPALDPFNALLNYAYGILYGLIESQMIKVGVDPTIGVLHADGHNTPSLVFDMIEPFRPWMDYVVLFLIQQEAIDPNWMEEKDGGFRCDTLTKTILWQAIAQYFDEVITLERRSASRREHLRQYIQQFAQVVKKYNYEND